MVETAELTPVTPEKTAEMLALIDGLLATTTRSLIPAGEVQDFVLDMRNLITSN